MIQIKRFPNYKKNRFFEFFRDNLQIFIIILLLIFCGVINQLNMGESSFLWKALLWHLMGLIFVVIGLIFVDYRKISLKLVKIIYWILVFVLGVMFLFKKRWLHFGFFSFQPSEFIKPIVLLLIVYEIEHHNIATIRVKEFLKLIGYIVLPLILIIRTDLDYGFIMGLMFVSLLLLIGVSRGVILLIIFMIFAGIMVSPFLWSKLKPHQKGRIYGFIYPEKYATTWGYQLYQSLVALGSGGFWGQGYKKGWCTRLNFLPAKRTDLAFAVWGESFGFLGSLFFLFLYLFLLNYTLFVSSRAKDWIGRYLSAGVGIILFFQAFFNVGGVIGLLPMASIPLPFLSYGGSSTISLYILLFFLFNVEYSRFIFK